MIDKPLYDNPLGGGASYFNPIGHTPNPSIGMQNPGEGNLANLEDGLMFLIDKDRPRTEDEIKSLYQKAQEDAARQRREGFMGQVVLPGEMQYEDYRNMNLYNFKMNTLYLNGGSVSESGKLPMLSKGFCIRCFS